MREVIYFRSDDAFLEKWSLLKKCFFSNSSVFLGRLYRKLHILVSWANAFFAIYFDKVVDCVDIRLVRAKLQNLKSIFFRNREISVFSDIALSFLLVFFSLYMFTQWNKHRTLKESTIVCSVPIVFFLKWVGFHCTKFFK